MPETHWKRSNMMFTHDSMVEVYYSLRKKALLLNWIAAAKCQTRFNRFRCISQLTELITMEAKNNKVLQVKVCGKFRQTLQENSVCYFRKIILNLLWAFFRFPTATIDE